MHWYTLCPSPRSSSRDDFMTSFSRFSVSILHQIGHCYCYGTWSHIRDTIAVCIALFSCVSPICVMIPRINIKDTAHTNYLDYLNFVDINLIYLIHTAENRYLFRPCSVHCPAIKLPGGLKLNYSSDWCFSGYLAHVYIGKNRIKRKGWKIISKLNY